MADKKEVARLQELAYQMRVNLVKLCGSYAGNIHMGGDMSMSDVLTCLFHHTMNIAASCWRFRWKFRKSSICPCSKNFATSSLFPRA